MHPVNPSKRFRGTGLYRNHSRRRGDKESHIRDLILQAEEEYHLALATQEKSRVYGIEKALTHYQAALSLIDALHPPTLHAHEEQMKIRNSIKDRMEKIRHDGE